MTINNELLILGKNLRLLRERDKLTVGEMAKILKVGVKAYEQLEQGILPKRVGVDCLLYAADYFGLSPAALFKTQAEKPHPL